MKVIPLCKKIILPVFLIILFALSINNASAITYQTPVDVNFTFNSTLSISLSSADLLIANLAPGASASSNTITVSVDTNNITGYTLYATVGDGTTYTNSRLTNSSSNTYFDNLTSSSTLSNFGDNKWGYALGTISSNTTYSGLVYNTNTTINATTNASGAAATGYTGTSDTSFTIAAKASDTQASGDYKNIIIFTVVSNMLPRTINDLEYMQDFATMTPVDKTSILSSMTINTHYQLADSRDGKIYYIAKLADGNVWMTQNLDHDIGDISGGTYTSADTDLPAAISWTPSASEETHATNDTTWNWLDNTEPESYDPGDLCWSENFNTNWDGTLSTETESCTQEGNHYHIGNYYNWTAAVAMSDSSSYTADGTDVNQSICPAGWMLPKSGHTLTGSGSFINLVTEYDWVSNSNKYFTGSYTAWGEPLRLTLGGSWYGMSYQVATTAYFWSSVVENSNNSYGLNLTGDEYPYSWANPQYSYNRYNGVSVRCVAR